MSLKVGSPRLPGIDFWKSQGSFWESLTPRLPLMQALSVDPDQTAPIGAV